MSTSIAAQAKRYKPGELKPGDVLISNHPIAGGSKIFFFFFFFFCRYVHLANRYNFSTRRSIRVMLKSSDADSIP